jgi:hypothetical protein
MPLCDGCHAEKNQGEERLRDVIAIDIGGSDHPEALRQLLTSIRGHNRRPGRSTQRISQRRQIEVVNPNGIYLGDAFKIDWDFAPVLRTLEIAVRCLYRYFRGELFPPNSPVEVVFIEPVRRAAVVKHVSRFRPRDLIVLADGIVHIASYDGPDNDPTATLWTITFNYGVLFVAATGSGVESFRRTTRR